MLGILTTNGWPTAWELCGEVVEAEERLQLCDTKPYKQAVILESSRPERRCLLAT